MAALARCCCCMSGVVFPFVVFVGVVAVAFRLLVGVAALARCCCCICSR